jgi:PhzF family phenazine biosynthesis protein
VDATPALTLSILAVMEDIAGGTLSRLAAFTTDPSGGNPAGVWIGPTHPDDATMQAIAAEVGYSETAFLAPSGTSTPGEYRVRYFSPLAEVAFCGHATIASGVALGAGPADGYPDGGSSRLTFVTNDGPVAVDVAAGPEGRPRATLTSIETWVRDPEPWLLAGALELLGWDREELDLRLPPAVAFAGVRHLILAAADYERLEALDYPFEPLRSLMLQAELTTIQLVWRESAELYRARDPFPVGGQIEDPATGAAAAAFGAYLRHLGELVPPATFEILQGVEMGRPSHLTVTLVAGQDGVRVTGDAVPIEPLAF